MEDHFKTIKENYGPSLYKIKNSKFYAYAFCISSEEEIKNHIANIKKEHYQARHWCYAWRLGTEVIRYRANDDGEPSNTAGQPILGQLQSFDLTNTLIIVVRYFGGVKLGVGGLISAYRSAAQLCLEESIIITKQITDITELQFEYALMNKVMSAIKKQQITIHKQELENTCKIWIATPKSKTILTRENFAAIYGVKVVFK